MIDATLVNRIAELAVEAAQPKIIDVDGVPHSTRQLHDVRPKEPAPDPIILSSLSGFVDYVNANPDGLNLAECVVVIHDPGRVALYSKLVGVHRQRLKYAEAVAPAAQAVEHRLRQFQEGADPEKTIIRLKTWCKDGGDRDRVVQILGNLTDEEIKTMVDDGFTQKATVRSGIQVVDEVRVPNPVNLAPWRTFGEIEQPTSPFLLRLSKGPQGPIVTLAIADDVTWRVEVVDEIWGYLHRAIVSSKLKILR